jgi:hypothetical protein
MKTKHVVVLFVFSVLVGVVFFRNLNRISSPLPHAVVSDVTISSALMSHERGVAHLELSGMGSASAGEARPVVHPLSDGKIIQQILSEPMSLANMGKAAEFAQSLEPGELRDRVMNRITQVWAMKDPETAMNWAGQRANPEERDRLMEIIVSEREKKDAPDATESQVVEDLSAAVNQISADDSKKVQVENLTQKWAFKNLPAAMDWVEQQPGGEIRDNLIERIAIVQSETVPDAAARLVVKQIPPGPTQAEAVISVVHQWGLRDLAGAAAWVNLFPDEEFKERAVKELEGIAQQQNNNKNGG